jgi:DNA-binding transcriptional ArsR family regulator
MLSPGSEAAVTRTRRISVGGRREKPRVTPEASAAYEFLLSLSAYLQPDVHSTLEEPPLAKDRSAELSSALRQAAAKVGDHSGRAWLELLPLVREPRLCHSGAELLERVAAIPPRELRLTLLGYFGECGSRPGAQTLIRAAANSDSGAQRTLYADPEYFDGMGRQLAPLFALSERQTRSQAMTVLRRWYGEVFSKREPIVRPILERDSEAKRALLASVAPERALEIASGIEWGDVPGEAEVALVPQLALRPFVISVMRGSGWILCHPVASESLTEDPTAPPSHMLRILKALADERRLRTLQALPPEGASLQDMTRRLGWPKTTVHHHLLVLRSAGLVRSTADRRFVPRLDIIPEAIASVERYLMEDQGQG